MNNFEKYTSSYDEEVLKLIIQTSLSDIIYRQHTDSYMTMNGFLIAFELIIVIASVLVSIFTELTIAPITGFINILLLIVVIINNKIHNKTWKIARNRSAELLADIDIYHMTAKINTLEALKQYMKDQDE